MLPGKEQVPRSLLNTTQLNVTVGRRLQMAYYISIPEGSEIDVNMNSHYFNPVLEIRRMQISVKKLLIWLAHYDVGS